MTSYLVCTACIVREGTDPMRLGATLRCCTAANTILFAFAAAAAFGRGGRVALSRTQRSWWPPVRCSSNTRHLAWRRWSRHRGRRLRRGVLASTAQAKDAEDNDLLKWERMYYQSKVSSSSSGRSSDGAGVRVTRAKSQVRVVSFDLDNTVWRTSPTIASANDALSEFLRERHGVPSTVRVERIMKDLSQSDPGKYNPAFATAVLAENIDKGAAPPAGSPQASPVLLTMLRKDAIRVVLKNHGEGESDGDRDEALLSAWIDQAFEHWVEARHDAIARHMADDVASCLSQIASLRTAEGHPVLIGAITDGNSDPSLVETLEPFFDFCVNAERVGAAKPDKRVYLEAAAIASSHPSVKAVRATMDRTTEEEMVGPWWVHIGDDFIKDVVASKSLGMRSVWCRELVSSSSYSGAGRDAKDDTPSRSVEDLVKQVSEMKVVRMEVGADDYLASSLHDEFADAVVDRFSDLSTLLHDWHKEGLANHDESAADNTLGSSRLFPEDTNPVRLPEPSRSDASAERKFCIHCGITLPTTAAFCSGCGQKQM